MQAIFTRYLPPSDMKGSRIKAWCDAGQVIIPYPYEQDDAHRFVAETLREKLGWTTEHYGRLLQGSAPQNVGACVFVFTGKENA